MSDERHPDLERFYESLAEEIADNENDEFETGELEVYENEFGMWTNQGDAVLHDMDIDEEYDEDDDDEEFLDPEDDDEDDTDEDDEGVLGVTIEPEDLTGDGSGDEEGADEGTAFLNLADLLNRAGTSADARSSLLARILAGAGPAGGTRSGGQGLLSSLRQMATPRPVLTPQQQQQAAAARRRKEREWWTEQKEPHPKGTALLQSGEFGRVGDWRVPGGSRRPRCAVQRRKAKTWVPLPAKATLPNTNGTVVARYPSVPYVGQYAGEDYGLFYAATQNFTLHLYATGKSRAQPMRQDRYGRRRKLPQAAQVTMTAAEEAQDDMDEDEDDADYPWGSWGMGGGRRNAAPEDTSLRKIKNVQGIEGSWSVTDCDATKLGDRMIYSSITPYVHMIYTSEDDSEHIELDFSRRSQRRMDLYGYDGLGIWSIRFSADGKEVVAGCRAGQIMTYDLDAQQRTLAISGHADDVNAVCFADESSTNILVSGADDGYVKVWDRRSLSSNTPSGVLVGATEGITYTSPKGDGRYVVVNSKDQAARLYDLRQMRSWSDFESEPDAVRRYGKSQFDYRTTRYPHPRFLAHPKDCSVMTFRGHSVLQTLIRCHFSPRESTGQSYIYSGSADGMIHIWSLDGRVAQVLNRAQTNPLRTQSNEYTDPSAPERTRRNERLGAMPYEGGRAYTVRDVSWHGYEPTLMSTCWDVSGGYRRGGSVAKHEWKGLGKGGLNRLEDWVEKEKQESEELM